MTIAAISGLIRPMLEPHLPEGIEVRWFMTHEEALAAVADAEIGWFDMNDQAAMAETLRAATRLKWLNSIYAGLDFLPMDVLIERGITVTNGAGINAITIAEYVVMGMLTTAKGYREVVRAQDRHEWLTDSPGKRELAGSKALLLGYGAIGQLIKPRLEAFEVAVTVVRRTPGEGVLAPDQWRAKLGEFDWVILAVPATPETDGMIGASELAAMKADAVLVNIARGAVVDRRDGLVVLGTDGRGEPLKNGIKPNAGRGTGAADSGDEAVGEVHARRVVTVPERTRPAAGSACQPTSGPRMGHGWPGGP
ncbi:hypothetical protein J4558_25445 [Leptolyngbya sp. 15MV]|nr:hypothetical protein J4558_25445 [Leptolyngbya sp. 15MV]